MMRYKALITQREEIDSYGTLIDKMESNYINYFEELNIDLRVVSNFQKNIVKDIKNENIDLIIFTGGGTVATEYLLTPTNEFIQKNRDKMEKELFEYGIENNIPILGICRGMQYINGLLGGKISKLSQERNIALDHKVTFFDEIIKVNNYHNDGIYLKDLAKELDIISKDKDYNIVEAFYSKNKKILGIQWHPERKFEDIKGYSKTRELIEKFIKTGGII
ncbi:gamma-glutamyl-gamma-aminobutyrate hydrolase family protein [Fusobacterium varium]|uniref:gamma-glutamyl-gamma-aminobutyrate hydrolase family protein n=1 Tax=Fusobacterium varium TaxID=856 RepID=UPI0030CAF524